MILLGGRGLEGNLDRRQAAGTIVTIKSMEALVVRITRI